MPGARANPTVLIFAIGIALGGCAGMQGPPPPPVTAAMVGAGGGASQATLEAGHRILTTRCTACHRAYPVTKFGDADWRRVVGQMKERSKLNDAEEAAVLAYLHAAPSALPPGP